MQPLHCLERSTVTWKSEIMCVFGNSEAPSLPLSPPPGQPPCSELSTAKQPQLCGLNLGSLAEMSAHPWSPSYRACSLPLRSRFALATYRIKFTKQPFTLALTLSPNHKGGSFEDDNHINGAAVQEFQFSICKPPPRGLMIIDHRNRVAEINYRARECAYLCDLGPRLKGIGSLPFGLIEN